MDAKLFQKNYQIKSVQLLVVTGSRLYGTNRPGSDLDLRGFFIPEDRYILGLSNCEQVELEGDTTLWTMQKFLKLVLNGCPQSTEVLFAPKENIRYVGPAGQDVLDNRSKFLSKRIYRRICGFGYSEWNKARGVKKVVEKRSQTENEAVNSIRNTFKPDKYTMDRVLELLYEDRPVKYVDSKANLGEKRKADFEKHGYGTSSACHAIRLMQQLEELLSTGTITFPRPNADFLRNIRLGKVSFDEAEVEYEKAKRSCQKLIDSSSLPEKPDFNAAEGILVKHYRNSFS